MKQQAKHENKGTNGTQRNKQAKKNQQMTDK